MSKHSFNAFNLNGNGTKYTRQCRDISIEYINMIMVKMIVSRRQHKVALKYFTVCIFYANMFMLH